MLYDPLQKKIALFILLLIFVVSFKVVYLVGGGSVINKAIPSSFLMIKKKTASRLPNELVAQIPW